MKISLQGWRDMLSFSGAEVKWMWKSEEKKLCETEISLDTRVSNMMEKANSFQKPVGCWRRCQSEKWMKKFPKKYIIF